MIEKKFRAWHETGKAYCGGTTANMFKWIEDGQPILLEQFTGLHDSKGVEIYEGDIVDCSKEAFPYDEPSPTQIVFEDGSFRRKHPKEDWPKGIPNPILSQRDIQVMHYCVTGTIHDEVQP